ELQHVDPAGGAERQLGEVLVGQDHDLAGGQLVPLGDLAVRDLRAVDGADPLVLDPPAVGAVHLVEGDVLLLGRREQLHRDGDQPERDGALPDAPHAHILASSFEIGSGCYKRLASWAGTHCGGAVPGRRAACGGPVPGPGGPPRRKEPEMTANVRVRVDGRDLALSNLDKVLYPDTGFTKAEVIDYYARIAPVMLPHLRDRPLTVTRYPDGAGGEGFYEKNAPAHTPDWVRTVTLPAKGSTKQRDRIDFALVNDLPTLVYYANLAALEIHVPMWRVGADGTPLPPDTLVFDLDPGAPATIVDCCRVALLLRDALAGDGLTGCVKTSGKKGIQVYVPWERGHGTAEYARRLASTLEAEHPCVTSVMA